MDNSWVKLYRKLGENDVMLDDKALRIFIWLLIHVDKKSGSLTCGRFQISRELEINPSTARDALYRLRDKYKIIDTTSDNKKTTVSLLNWSKYQAKPESNDTSDDSKTTARRQPDDTKQEYKNKEYKNTTNVVQGYGNPDITELIAYLKKRLGLPLLDDSEQTNRRYAKLCMTKFGGVEKVKLLIDSTAKNRFWSTKITSFKSLYYKGVQIVSSARGEVKSIDATKVLHSKSGQGRDSLDSGGVPAVKAIVITGNPAGVVRR